MLALMVALMVGCIQARGVPCGELLCPVGMECVGDAICATRDQIDAQGWSTMRRVPRPQVRGTAPEASASRTAAVTA